MEGAETVVYVGLALVLFVAAGAALVVGGYGLVDGLLGDDGTKLAIEVALDGLLLAFILVELLGAVRTTLAERVPLVAEPFLLVGIIAAIKEMVVLSAFERDDLAVEDLALHLGVLAGVVLALAAAALLVRRKEREPQEGEAATLRAEPSLRSLPVPTTDRSPKTSGALALVTQVAAVSPSRWTPPEPHSVAFAHASPEKQTRGGARELGEPPTREGGGRRRGAERLGASSAALLTEYRGLSVRQLAQLRRQLRDAGGEMKVYKNTLVRFAARDLGLEIEELLTGPTAIAFVDGDPVNVAKALRDFARTNPALVVKGGLLGDKTAVRRRDPGPGRRRAPRGAAGQAGRCHGGADGPVRRPAPGPAPQLRLRPQGPHRTTGRSARAPAADAAGPADAPPTRHAADEAPADEAPADEAPTDPTPRTTRRPPRRDCRHRTEE